MASVQSTTGSRGVRISGSNAGYTTFRGSVKGTGYPLHSPVSPSLPLPCVTVCHHISTGLNQRFAFSIFRVTETCTMKKYTVTPYETLVLNQTIPLYSSLNIIICCILFFGVIPRRLNFMCRRFGTLCYIFIGGVNILPAYTIYEDGTQSVPKRRHIKFRRRE